MFGSIVNVINLKQNFFHGKPNKIIAYFSTPCFMALFFIKQSISSIAHYPHPLNSTTILRVSPLSLSPSPTPPSVIAMASSSKQEFVPLFRAKGQPLPTSPPIMGRPRPPP